MKIVKPAELAKIINTSFARRAYVKVELYKDAYGKEVKLPQATMILSNYFCYGVNQHHMRATFANGTVSSYYFHDDCQIEILDEGNDEFKLLKEKMDANAFNNLEQYLGHSCSSVITGEIFAVKPSGNVFPCWQQCKEKNDNYAYAKFTSSSNTCLAWTMDSLQGMFKTAYQQARSAKTGSKLTISSVMELGNKTLREANEKNLTVYEADVKNAYGLKYSLPEPREMILRGVSAKPTWLSANITEDSAPEIIKSMDAVIGITCVSLLQELDEPVLRTLHALPGEYRMIGTLGGSYGGLEYGGLSNGWLCHPFIANLVFDLSRKTLALAQGGYSAMWKATEDEVVNTMLNCDVTKAHEILERNKHILYKMFKAAWGYEGKNADKLFEIIMGGVSVAVKDPKDLVTNWVLEGPWRTHCDGTNKNVRLTVTDLVENPKLRIA